MTLLCIYHADCADGLGAAWVVHKALGPEVEFVAAKYGQEPPSCAGRDVLIVDFSYPLSVLRAMAAEARSVLVLDHHKTAQEDLHEIPRQDLSWQSWLEYNADGDKNKANLAAIFDLDRSGAGIAWDYLSGVALRPRIINLIEDRDLWHFKFGDETWAFHAVLMSYDITNLPAMFKLLNSWLELDWFKGNPKFAGGLGFDSHVLAEGRAILRANAQAVASAVAASRRTIRIASYVAPCANVPPAMASEAGHLLCDPKFEDGTREKTTESGGWMLAFSATYYDGADGKRHFSLRSPEGGADVGQIARQMAERFNGWKALGEEMANMKGCWTGGGHPHAAGFDAPLTWEGE